MFTKKYASTLEKYEEFWERKNTGRPILNLSYKKAGFSKYREPVSLEEKYLDVSYRYNYFKHKVANTGYLAEGIPMIFTNFGPGCLSACIGGGFELTPRSIWFDTEQFIKNWENPPEIAFNENSELWSKVVEAQKLYMTDPDTHFSITDIGGILDIIASLRGTQELLFDLYDYPDELKEFAGKVKTEWYKAFDQQLKTIEAAGQPYNNWMNVPSSKPWYPLQCDFAYMIAPDQFEEFVLPDLTEMVNYMPRSIYHLDGPGELPHVDMILDIENLTGIQWIAGDAHEPLTDEKWFGLYKRIQDKKKNLILLDAIDENDMAGAERLIKTLDPTGVYIRLNCSSEDKAKDVLEKITRWSE